MSSPFTDTGSKGHSDVNAGAAFLVQQKKENTSGGKKKAGLVGPFYRFIVICMYIFSYLY